MGGHHQLSIAAEVGGHHIVGILARAGRVVESRAIKPGASGTQDVKGWTPVAVPDARCAVLTADREDVLAVRAESDRRHVAGVAAELSRLVVAVIQYVPN